MVSILHFHAKFTIESVRVAVALLQPKWDAYDQANNRDLIQFFFNSLDVKSERLLRENREDGDVAFVVLWMIFQRTIASVSVNRYESLKVSIRTTQPSQFPGQNILHFALKVKMLCQELQDADQCEHHLNLHIIKNLLKGGGERNELWRVPFLITVPQLHEALLDIAPVSHED